MYQIFMDSPIGKIRIVEHEGQIKEISLADLPGARLNKEGSIIKSVESFPCAVWLRTLQEIQVLLHTFYHFSVSPK